MIILPAHIERVFQQNDQSWNAKLSFGELNPDQVAKLASATNKALVIGITIAEDFTEEEKELLQQIAEQFIMIAKKASKENKSDSILFWD